jgi:hypothetical protein
MWRRKPLFAYAAYILVIQISSLEAFQGTKDGLVAMPNSRDRPVIAPIAG